MRPAAAAVLAALALGLAAGPAPAGENLAGPPRVVDGDTLEVAGVRIELYGVDAPEPQQRCRDGARSYPCGQVATTALKDLTAGMAVVCKPRGKGADGALVATCYAEGYDVGENMVYTGWALADRAESARYAGVEQGAREAGRGLWRGDFVRPEAWRRGQRLPAHAEE